MRNTHRDGSVFMVQQRMIRGMMGADSYGAFFKMEPESICSAWWREVSRALQMSKVDIPQIDNEVVAPDTTLPVSKKTVVIDTTQPSQSSATFSGASRTIRRKIELFHDPRRQVFVSGELCAIFESSFGSLAPEFASSRLLATFTSLIANIRSPELGEKTFINTLSAALSTSIKDVDKEFLALDSNTEDGTDALVVLVVRLQQKSVILSANIGQSRAVIFKDNKVDALNVTHHPLDKAERERIEAAGGWLVGDKTNGELAVARGIGYKKFKAPWQNEGGWDFPPVKHWNYSAGTRVFSMTEDVVSSDPTSGAVTVNPNEDASILIAGVGILDSLDSTQVPGLINSIKPNSNCMVVKV